MRKVLYPAWERWNNYCPSTSEPSPLNEATIRAYGEQRELYMACLEATNRKVQQRTEAEPLVNAEIWKELSSEQKRELNAGLMQSNKAVLAQLQAARAAEDAKARVLVEHLASLRAQAQAMIKPQTETREKPAVTNVVIESASAVVCANCQKTHHAHEYAFLVSKANSQKIDLSIITEEEANKAFADIVERGDIPFEYLKDGCYSRAHKMALVLDDKGIISGKAFMEGKIYYDTPQHTEVGWTYQVAPVILVRKNEQVIPYIIDPSFFTRPVSLDEWRAVLTKKSKTEITAEYFTNRFAYDPRDRNTKYDDYREDQLDDMDDRNRDFMRALYVMKVRK